MVASRREVMYFGKYGCIMHMTGVQVVVVQTDRNNVLRCWNLERRKYIHAFVREY